MISSQCGKCFLTNLFPQRSRSENIIRKCDTIFQIVFNLVHNGRKNVPLHIGISQSIHDKCRSKQLMQIFNKLGLCISYDELERIYCSLANEITDSCVENKVPLPLLYSALWVILTITKILYLWYFRILTPQQKLRMFYTEVLIVI